VTGSGLALEGICGGGNFNHGSILALGVALFVDVVGGILCGFVVFFFFLGIIN
jgi:hypothetical protein